MIESIRNNKKRAIVIFILTIALISYALYTYACPGPVPKPA